MKALNVGIVKDIITRNMSNDYIVEGRVDNSKIKASEFLKIVSNSPLLQLEYKVFDRLEKKHISNDMAATRYIDNNLSLFEGYTQEQLIQEHNKIKKFVDKNIAFIDDNKYNFYVALGNLISETLNDSNPDVDLIHESFTTVLNHVTEEKEVVVEEKVNELQIPKEVAPEKLIEVAINKFSEKYASLTEDDMRLIKNIASSNDRGRNDLFETLKKDNLRLLESTNKEGVEDKINGTIDKIKKMEFKNESSIKDIMSLHELKMNLL